MNANSNQTSATAKAAKIIMLPVSKRFIVAVGETGFTSTKDHGKATRFASAEDAHQFCQRVGIFVFEIVN